MKSFIPIIPAIILLNYSCKTEPTIPELVTFEAEEISYTSAICTGELKNDGGSPVTMLGLCWSTAQEPTINNPKKVAEEFSGLFKYAIGPLLPGTTYYVRAFGVNEKGPGYGPKILFTTKVASAPVITTAVISSVTNRSAASGGSVTDEKGSNVSKRGVCWSLLPEPVITGNSTVDGSGPGQFTSVLTDLSPGTTYHLRAYAVNSSGTAYGNEFDFKTVADVGTISTSIVTSVSSHSAICGGIISDDGGSIIISRGLCWNTSPTPTTDNYKISNGSGTGIFVATLTGLSENTDYFLRAYAINSVGTAYGQEVTFRTKPAIPPEVLTNEQISVGTINVNTGGTVINDGGLPVIMRGVCWSFSQAPRVSDNKTSDGSGTGSFTTLVEGLEPNTRYYLRAYATNQAGTGYGPVISFTTYSAKDGDGNYYNSVSIGTQIWLKENLRTTRFSNGDQVETTTPAILPLIYGQTNIFQWAYQGYHAYSLQYGRLYTGYVVLDGRNICPEGWHVPSDNEWRTLSDFLTMNGYGLSGNASAIGKSMAETQGWTGFQTEGTIGNDQASNNRSGFSALPGGMRYSDGGFAAAEGFGYWWSTTKYNADCLYYRELQYFEKGLYRQWITMLEGNSVRCLKNP